MNSLHLGKCSLLQCFGNNFDWNSLSRGFVNIQDQIYKATYNVNDFSSLVDLFLSNHVVAVHSDVIKCSQRGKPRKLLFGTQHLFYLHTRAVFKPYSLNFPPTFLTSHVFYNTLASFSLENMYCFQ